MRLIFIDRLRSMEGRYTVPMLWTSRLQESGERLWRSIVARVGSSIPMPWLRLMAARGSKSYRESALRLRQPDRV